MRSALLAPQLLESIVPLVPSLGPRRACHSLSIRHSLQQVLLRFACAFTSGDISCRGRYNEIASAGKPYFWL